VTTIEKRFQTPDGWQWGQITPRAGQFLRYGWVAPKAAHALCVIFPGLSEYCEKYFEVVHDLMDRGFAVACIDWRGQGLSWRHLPDTQKRHHDDFALDTQDAIGFLAALNSNSTLASLPKLVLGHSMGGHIALRTIHSVKDAFRCAVLTAPMFGINLPFEGLARFAAEGVCRSGFDEHYALGMGPWSMNTFLTHLNYLTNDYDHRMIVMEHMDKNPDLRTGGVTFGWVRAALNSIQNTTHNPKWLRGVTTPTLVFMPELDTIVSNDATRAGVASIPSATLVEVNGALHEILMEIPKHRNKFWQGFDAYVAKHINPM
jgi:lysophospholipase